MRGPVLLVICGVFASCTRSPRSTQREPVTPAPLPVVSAPPPAPDADLTRCLPVVARECGCVYDCGLGTPNGDGFQVVAAPGETHRSINRGFGVAGDPEGERAAMFIKTGKL